MIHSIGGSVFIGAREGQTRYHPRTAEKSALGISTEHARHEHRPHRGMCLQSDGVSSRGVKIESTLLQQKSLVSALVSVCIGPLFSVCPSKAVAVVCCAHKAINNARHRAASCYEFRSNSIRSICRRRRYCVFASIQSTQHCRSHSLAGRSVCERVKCSLHWNTNILGCSMGDTDDDGDDDRGSMVAATTAVIKRDDDASH